ncbi:hypothetical protein [Rariglobus hedericola]|uniref:hypothetical protein n=1 Tax=Rariglobus hedericola TaxID=2597822 RepID=UPI001396B070|nr:hypothetical protein [Rariglobus hedericola]
MPSLLLLVFGPIALLLAEPAVELGHVEGRVLSRVEGKKLERVGAAHVLVAGEALITGDASRFEIKTSGGIWRVGRRAVFVLSDNNARLLAGTALLQVPSDQVWSVTSRRSVLGVPAGTWLVQAVDNGGFKIVCIDSDQPIQAKGETSKPLDPAVQLKLRPGELVFLQPGGATFSPIVTIFLEELLATSRLVGGFPDELPGLRRIVNQAVAQRDRLKTLSNAVVVGATEAGSFQIAVPNPAEKKAEAAKPSEAKP